MDDNMLWQFALQLISMGVTALCGWFAGKIKGAANERKEKQREDNSERDMVRSMLRLLMLYRIIDIHAEAMAAGCASAAAKHQLEEAYSLYHGKLDGNGTGTQMYQEVMALPTK